MSVEESPLGSPDGHAIELYPSLQPGNSRLSKHPGKPCNREQHRCTHSLPRQLTQYRRRPPVLGFGDKMIDINLKRGNYFGSEFLRFQFLAFASVSSGTWWQWGRVCGQRLRLDGEQETERRKCNQGPGINFKGPHTVAQFLQIGSFSEVPITPQNPGGDQAFSTWACDRESLIHDDHVNPA